MSDESRGHRSYLPLVVGIPCLLLFYVLSIGPAAWVITKLSLPQTHWVTKAATAFYAPLVYVVKQTDTEPVIIRYLSLFVDFGPSASP
jgi:hypothetical protein